MIKQIKMVENFHRVFGLLINEKPTVPDKVVRELRDQLHMEECKEVGEAMDKYQLEEVTKELADLAYVLFGTVVSYGLQDKFEQAFNLVHASNMSKAGPDGKAIINGQNGVYDTTRPLGKVLKPDTYKPADLGPLFQ